MFAVIDTETTHINPAYARIIDIAVIHLNDGVWHVRAGEPRGRRPAPRGTNNRGYEGEERARRRTSSMGVRCMSSISWTYS